ncbi:Acid phosphatase PHO11 [Wickerhamomyces ciferrii]|uniref:acid phosphatase n=1 Tax=Wickerhamomyces ciferrii (strain ATCC 14091 / BCRC 22168 / CBS 111 / JCM 3599 / NBRC 0793 / NRRL Y-1031 F-60-10) TaxID=1206466 RepID=K0KLF8_WICCF|nr:Acid phosphatase PHO11 [Wickerhamomyces ciferrii]CCH42204.1 Acid phosphatase PHO11 [Wickerhamomyces ciferrii]
MQLSTTVLSALALSITAVDALPIGSKSESIRPYSQEALDQFSVLRFLGTASPYVQNTGYGIERDAPYQCKVTQANLISRHGERYPTSNQGKKMAKHFEQIQNGTETIEGPLSFLKDYEFKALDEEGLDQETGKGPYSGLLDLYKHGALFRDRYDDLYNEGDEIKFYSASQKRVVESAKKFAQGFLGESYNESYIQEIDEDTNDLGANSLTPVNACNNYDKHINQDKIDELSTSFLNKTADRLNNQSPGINLIPEQVGSLIYYCGFELNVEGSNQICEIFTTDELLAYSYTKDVSYYYEKGPGNNLSATIGSVYIDAITRLIKDDSKNLTLSFAHDTDIFYIVSLLGLFDGELPTDHQSFNHLWKISNIAPMGARLVIERLECEDQEEPFVRIIHNDAVLPIPGHSEGPGYSISISDFEKYIEDKLDGKTYEKDCGTKDGVPTELTFFWD